jgi:tetratricopeptide (TPR) repeat protein
LHSIAPLCKARYLFVYLNIIILKSFIFPLSFVVAFLYLTDTVGQKIEDQIINDVIKIEATLYQNPINAKYQLQKIIENNPNVSDTTKSLLYLKWGTTLGMTNNLDSAIWAVKKSYQLSPEQNIEKGSALKILAILYRLKGNYKEAEKALIESLQLNKNIWKNPMHDAITLQEYGSLCLDQYDYDRALGFYLQALDTMQSPRFTNSKKSMLIAKLRINLGETYILSDNYQMAIREFEASIPTLDSLQDIEGLVVSCNSLANAYISLKLFHKADSLLNRVYPLTEKLENDELKAFILLGKANSFVAQGNTSLALANFQQAFAIMNKNNSASILDCVNPYLKLLIETGAETEAKQLMSSTNVQAVLSSALPKDLLEFRKSEVLILWKDKSTTELHTYYQDLIQLADSVYLDERRKSALQAQAKYQFERQKEVEEHLLTENSLLKEKEAFKKTQLLMSIAIGLLISFVLLLIVRRLQMRTRQQKMEIAINEKEITYHKERSDWAEREKAFREKLIEQQKNIITKAIEDADLLRAEMEKIVKEQKQPKREELLAQFELIKKENLGIDLLTSQFNALHPLYTQTLIKRFPKLSQADIQFCTFLRMNLTTKEISSLLNIEPRSIYVKKYRIMEKMGLGENDDFEKLLFDVG